MYCMQDIVQYNFKVLQYNTQYLPKNVLKYITQYFPKNVLQYNTQYNSYSTYRGYYLNLYSGLC